MSDFDRHHRKCRSNGGTSDRENISIVRVELHKAWHRLFANATPEEVAKIISDVWIDPSFEMIAVRRHV